MALVFLRVTALVYLVAAGLAFAQLVRPSAAAERRAQIATLIALVAHALAVGGRVVEMGAFPLADVHDALSLFGFISALVAVVVALRGAVPQVAWLAMPLVALLVTVAAAFDPKPEVPEALRSPWLALHIGLALTGDAVFVIAGVVAVVYLLQERSLRARKKRLPDAKKGVGALSLPALEAIDKVSVSLFVFGFPLMTLGILSGAFYGKQVLDRYWTWDTRNTVSALVWVLYAAILHARLVIGWRGRRAAILTVVGVVAILLTFLGLGLFGVGVHSRGLS